MLGFRGRVSDTYVVYRIAQRNLMCLTMVQNQSAVAYLPTGSLNSRKVPGSQHSNRLFRAILICAKRSIGPQRDGVAPQRLSVLTRIM